MARELILLSGVLPNHENGKHYLFTADQYADYVSTMVNASTTTTYIGYDNYRLANNEARIFETSFADDYIVPSASYLIEREYGESESELTYFKAYFVDRVVRQSGFYILSLSVDNWATYLPKATLSSIRVTRCNRMISNTGKYDNVPNTLTYKQPFTFGSGLNRSQASVVFLMEYNVRQNVYGNDYITKTSLFYLTMQRIYDAVHTVEEAYDSIPIIEKAIDFIGGVFAVGGSAFDMNARVLKMWIVPTETITAGDIVLNSLKTKCMMSKGAELAISNVNTVTPKVYKKNIQYGSAINYSTWVPRYHVEIGAPYRALPIQRYIASSTVVYDYIFTNSGLSVIVHEGSGELDISESFEVSMTMNNATQTSLMKTAQVMSSIGRTVMSIAGAYYGGVTGKTGSVTAGLIAGASAGAGSAVSALGQIKDAHTLQSLGNGDGALTFNDNSATYLKSPYAIMYAESTRDEENHAKETGVSFDEYVETLLSIFDSAYIIDDSDFTFVQCDAVINSIPVEASDEIKARLATGVKLIKI